MPNSNSYVKVLRDWEQLLSAVVDNADDLAAAESLRLTLQQQMADARVLKARQDAATARRQKLTQELRKVLEDGRENAMRLRGIVKGQIGPKSELLVQFGMVPLRKRGPRSAKPPEVKPPQTPDPVATPRPGEKSEKSVTVR